MEKRLTALKHCLEEVTLVGSTMKHYEAACSVSQSGVGQRIVMVKVRKVMSKGKDSLIGKGKAVCMSTARFRDSFSTSHWQTNHSLVHTTAFCFCPNYPSSFVTLIEISWFVAYLLLEFHGP